MVRLAGLEPATSGLGIASWVIVEAVENRVIAVNELGLGAVQTFTKCPTFTLVFSLDSHYISHHAGYTLGRASFFSRGLTE